MKESIVNKVAKSPIVTIDLEDFKTEGIKTLVDIAQWLDEGLVLREKKFRNLKHLKQQIKLDIKKAKK